ncbi:MAG: ComEC/Rec2 family competence protein [Planctomycetaceae bacterium]
MLFSLDVLRAAKGDCLCLHFGTSKKPGLMLIDGGPATIYQDSLEPRLRQIRKERKIEESKPLPVDLVMISHIDDDHIQGMLDLFKSLADAQREKRLVSLKIKSLWHNSFARLLQQEAGLVQKTTAAAYGVASLGQIAKLEGLSPDVGKVLASVPQGATLENYASQLGISNQQSADGLIVAAKPFKPLQIGSLKVTILGPQQKEIDKLRKEFEKWVKNQAKLKAGAALAAYDDDSPFNLSSIVALVEAGPKKILLTGDARGDKILDGLRQAGLLKKGQTLHVDILKAPHHGSDRNIQPDFFESITADHYVFSGDGEHGNPERTTLEMLDKAGGDRDFEVHLTYPIEHIDAERKKDNAKQRKKKNSKTFAWSAAKDSLADFLKKNPRFARKLRIAPQNGKPHVIDLGDEPLGY